MITLDELKQLIKEVLDKLDIDCRIYDIEDSPGHKGILLYIGEKEDAD